MLLMVFFMLMMMLSVGLILIGLLYKACPNGWQRRCTNPAEAQALPREGASALVILPCAHAPDVSQC